MPKLVAVKPDLHLSESVAVVGNSSSLRNAEFGEEIDGYGDVIRFNGALTQGFERSVGSKTTMQVIGIDLAYLFNKAYLQPGGDESRMDYNRVENARRMSEFFPGARFLTFHDGDTARNEKNKQYMTSYYLESAAPHLPVFVFEENAPGAFLTYFSANKDLERLGINSRLSHGGPRTGIKIVMRCVMSGIVPVLYGFDVDTSLEFAQHYYDDVIKAPITEYKPHDIRGEMYLLAELHQKGLVRVCS